MVKMYWVNKSCMMCPRSFKAYLNPKKGHGVRKYIGIRPSKCVTCSKVCSKNYAFKRKCILPKRLEYKILWEK